MTAPLPDGRRPRFALPFNVLWGADRVTLAAGEDHRWALDGPGLDGWLPALLARVDGRTTVAQLLDGLEAERRESARGILERLYGERVLVDGGAAEAHPARRHRVVVDGAGELRAAVERALGAVPAGDGPELRLLCQDTLDGEEARRFNRRGLSGTAPWLWATVGPLARGFVGPPFLPDAGPCLACVLRGFQRLSPAPEVYAELERHAREGRPFAPATFPPRGLEMLASLALWKAEALSEPSPPAGLYRLHVLERAELEVTAHRVFADPECPDCAERR